MAANPRTDALPRTEGQIEVAGLASRVLIDRDDLGIPSITGESLLDVVRAQGFLHGQERFVQMDMTRRLAAGELAALVGPLMLDADRKYRAYRFRSVARRVINRMRPDHRELLRAYTEGVNEGLDDLEALPLEYQFLQSNPQVWKEEDSILVMLMMYDMLQGSARMEGMLGVMREALPEALFTFLTPLRTRFDVPILPDRTRKESSSYKPVAIPGPDVIDVRRRAGNNDQDEAERLVDAKRIDVGPHEMSLGLVDVSEIVIGSNNWAVAGQRSLHGGAILANDMHLALTSPGIWYRAEMN
ncbi:MAG: penicillin acylase family protein, partial [Planctomycetes bacterium]|nr:penicillin acylase family protein [Planctomycetota bacterium]